MCVRACVCVCGVHTYVRTQLSPPGPVSVPGGGVPLNMREVEELERMTKDFIKNMDTHAPVITSNPTGRRHVAGHVHVLVTLRIHILWDTNRYLWHLEHR